ncbi:MAG: hypothetical protein KDA96_20785 [Planctomycetaceae bacterium]|nr:hypothetical protein [Planctomycetaceae bacterium]
MLHDHSAITHAGWEVHVTSFHKDQDAAGWHWHFTYPTPNCPDSLPGSEGLIPEFVDLACAVAETEQVLEASAGMPLADSVAVLPSEPLVMARPMLPVNAVGSFLQSMSQSVPLCAITGVAVI